MLKWGRWGGWAAHLFDGDVQVCPTKHGLYMRGQSCGPTPPKFDDAPAAGLAFQKSNGRWDAVLRVTSKGTRVSYKLDRWD